jgi:hypothetical protein
VLRISQVEPLAENINNISFKVLGLWQTHKKFITHEKAPRHLSYGFEKSEFNTLVKMVSNDLNPATILFELERIGAVAVVDEKLTLVVKSYMPRGDVKGGFSLLSKDIEDLVELVSENIVEQPLVGNLHLRTDYDRIREDVFEELKVWLIKEGHALHEKAREKFSKFDQDVNPDPKYRGRYLKVILSSFGAVKKVEGEDE